MNKSIVRSLKCNPEIQIFPFFIVILWDFCNLFKNGNIFISFIIFYSRGYFIEFILN